MSSAALQWLWGGGGVEMSESGSPPNLPLLPETSESSLELQPRSEQELRPGGRVANKICRVCGDKALGYNFNVVSCESCKAFFRRNALAGKALRCPFDDGCAVNVVTRRLCQRCRLRKCFAVGMKKEWILSEEEKRRKRPRKRRLPSAPAAEEGPVSEAVKAKRSSTPEPSSSAPHGEEDSVRVPRELLRRLMESHSRGSGRARCTCTCACGFYPPGTELGPPPSLCSAQSQPSESSEPLSPTDPALAPIIPFDLDGCQPIEDGGLYQGMINQAVHSQMSEPVEVVSTASPHIVAASPSSPLSARDERKMAELLAAAAECVDSGREGRRPPESLSLTDVVNLTDVAVRRIIQMSKRIAGFRGLGQEDQIALLKGSCTEVMILQGLLTYDPETDAWNSGPRNIRCDVLKKVEGGEAYLQHKAYLSSFRAQWRTDERLMLLLMMIVLFQPSRPHLSQPWLVQAQQDDYAGILRRYLASTSASAEEAQADFAALWERVDQLHSLNETLQKIFLDVNPKDVEPLLIEIFDLK